jgi:putative acetyltransferase
MIEGVAIRPFAEQDAAQVRDLFMTINRLLRGDKVIGTFGLERASDDAMELRRMYVDASARRQGIARQMLQSAEEECRRRNISRLELSTAAIQRAAIALYKNAGYTKVREDIAEAASNKTVGSGIRRYYFEKLLR